MCHSYCRPGRLLATLFLTIGLFTGARAQTPGVGIGTAAPDAAAALDITATGKGLLIPRMDSATRAQIASPPTGLMVFQTTGRVGFWYYGGVSWLFLPDKSRSGDNLGSHTATQALKLAGQALTGTGASITGVGVGVRADGGLNIGQNVPGGNVYLGYLAGASNTTGTNNTFSGFQSGRDNTTGNRNTFSGFQSGRDNTTGTSNTFSGTYSGGANTTGGENTFSGFLSGASNTIGNNNVFNGSFSGLYNTTGESNTFSGGQSGLNNTTAVGNTFTGSFSGFYTTTGGQNTFVGGGSGGSNTIGTGNTALGYTSGPASANLTNTTAIGANVFPTQSNTVILGNGASVGIGTTSPDRPLTVQAASGSSELLSLRNNAGANKWHLNLSGGDLNFVETTVADYRLLLQLGGNVGIGTGSPTARLDVNGTARLRGLTTAGVVTTDASGNLGSTAAASLGDNLGNHTATQALKLAGQALTGTGASISGLGVGVRADGGLNIGQNVPGGNVYLGYLAGASNTTGGENTFNGFQSGRDNTTGNRNTFSGFQSGRDNTTGTSNTFAGTYSGASNTTGGENTFSGFLSGAANSTGNNNVFNGFYSGAANTTGESNTFSGGQSGLNNTTAAGNTFTGSFSGYNTTTGGQNTFVGGGSGYNNTTGTSNTALGYTSGPASANLTNTTAIGANVFPTQSNTVILGNGASVGIGTTTPNSTLQVNGSLAVKVSAALAGGSSTGSAVVLGDAGYFSLLPTAGSSFYQLPSAVTSVGRIYYFRNTSSSAIATLSTAGGLIYDGSSSTGVATYDLGTAGSSKSVTAVADGTNWTIFRSGN